jgi:hypothetical protein
VVNKAGINLKHNCGYPSYGAAKSIELVIKSGCIYYSYETTFNGIHYYEPSKENIPPYKFIRNGKFIIKI